MLTRTTCCVLLLCFFISSTDASIFIRGARKPEGHDQAATYFHKLKPALNAKQLPPVVLIPGIGGNQMTIELNKSSSNHWFCEKHDSWSLLWLQISQLLPGPPMDCFLANAELVYNNETKSFSNVTGALITPVGFGTTKGIEILDPSLPSETLYYGPMVDALVAIGYQRDQNLIGVPYDWRLSPRSSSVYYSNLTNLIESLYHTYNSPVVVIGHSMGCLYSLYFLNHMPQKWKDTYLRTYITVSPPWTGAVESVQALVSGDDFSIPVMLPLLARSLQRTFEATYFLMPSPSHWNDWVVVSTPTANYTTSQFPQLFADTGIANAHEIWSGVVGLLQDLTPPFVDTYCFYGTEMPTHVHMSYPSGSFNTQPVVTMGNGDGTVPIQSLTAAKIWAKQQPQLYKMKAYPFNEHVALLLNHTLISDVISILTQDQLHHHINNLL